MYEAFEDGRIDQERLRQVFARYVIQPAEEKRVWLGIDATSIERPQSKTSPDRTVVYVPNMPESSKPIGYGWQFSTVVILPEPSSSWTAVLEKPRIRSDQTSVEVAVAQLRELAPLLGVGCRPIVATDRWYSCAPFLLGTQGLPFDKLLRLKRKRVLYRAAPAPTGKRGAPRKDGERFQCATDQPRDPRERWFLWDGESDACVPQVALGYRRRYSHEHGYRFQKQGLLWAQPRLRTPAQFERWSLLVAIVHNHLVLARPLVLAYLRPWESSQRDASPQQVRRAMATIVAQLGTPGRPPQPRGKSPGRHRGAIVKLAPRYRVLYKSKPGPKKRRKRA